MIAHRTAGMMFRGAATMAMGAMVVAAPAAGQEPRSPVRVELELEGGSVWLSRNTAQIPNDDSGTRFSLVSVTGKGPWPAARGYVTWNMNERHGLRVLVAPLSIRETGTLASSIQFAGASYAPGAPVDAEYTFNSYRLTYRYRLREAARTSAWVGFTAKVRDATIALEQGATSSRKDDVGFVPLLHLAGEWRMTPRWLATADADALAGGPGRAEDVAVKLGFRATPRLSFHAGYRMVEGGADVPSTYSFAWLHFAVASVRWRP
ncbi:MAG TPA: hypothetical protein VFO55_13610 [Gemmatimonadaceae bacterium]|nr:hypothetical protein [Gemmatimonadaceae bacterium]